MNALTFEALRWLDEPVRITALLDHGRPQVFFQITTPREVMALGLGRPVEELPRILTLLSPAHHLASALALDQLFKVEPPPMAVQMREALRQTLFFEHHLRKLYFFFSSRLETSGPSSFQEKKAKVFPSAHQLLEDIMHHVALAQEAVTILGGRPDHPLSAVAGGVSRYLKEENFGRLEQIAKSCLKCALRLGQHGYRELLESDSLRKELAPYSLEPLSFLTLSEEPDSLVLRNGQGKERDRFQSEKMMDKIGLQHQPWSYESFAYIKGSSDSPDLTNRLGIEAFSLNQCFFIGPLARLNQDTPLTPLAEQERQRLLTTNGPLPLFDIPSAFWSLLLELLQVAEKMPELYRKENMLGPEPRTIPQAMGREGRAVLESPKGGIYHHYIVDEKGLVTDITVLDTTTANNAWRSLWAQKTIETALGLNYSPQEIKNLLEMVLLAF